MEFYTDDDGVTYVSCGYLCQGDYSGAGTVGEANIRALEDTEGAIVRHGAYYSRQLWLPDTEENREICRAMEEEYPLVDEQIHSEVECEWEREAWKNWLQSDLNKTLPDELGEVIDDDLTDDDQWELYREAMDTCNEYPIFGDSGCSVRIERIQDTYAELVIARLQQIGSR